MKRIFGVATLIGVGLLASACGSSSTATPTATATIPSGGADTPTAMAPGESTAREIAVDTQDFRFDPDSLNLVPGENVKFIVTNPTSNFHTFTLTMTSGKDEVFVDIPLDGGETKSAEFTVPTVTADLYLFCRPHEVLGMKGTLHIGTSGGVVHDDTQSALDADY